QIDISAGIEVGEIGRSAVIEFADTGCGIEPKNLPHIFEMGFTTTGQTPGLGLAVCQRIVEQHRGTIKVQSRLGRGTTFRMEFPVL
ncbi:MAG: ATP-binding protein, partial [Terriglobales bacterium]